MEFQPYHDDNALQFVLRIIVVAQNSHYQYIFYSMIFKNYTLKHILFTKPFQPKILIAPTIFLYFVFIPRSRKMTFNYGRRVQRTGMLEEIQVDKNLQRLEKFQPSIDVRVEVFI